MNEGPIEALRAMGASAETIEQARIKLGLNAAPEGMPVLPECWFAVRVFNAMTNQWNWASWPNGARRVGLKLESLPTVMAGLRHELHRRPLAELLPQLLVMEQAALEAMTAT